MKQWAAIIAICMFTACTSSKTESQETDSATVSVSAVAPVKDSAITETEPVEDYDSYLQLESYLVSEKGISPDEVQVMDSTCAIEVWPTEEQIKKMQGESDEEEFNTISEDGAFYTAEARSRIDSFKIKTVIADKKRYIRLKGANKSWLLDVRKDNAPFQNLIFFNVNKDPEIIDQVDMATNPEAITKMRQYFDLK